MPSEGIMQKKTQQQTKLNKPNTNHHQTGKSLWYVSIFFFFPYKNAYGMVYHTKIYIGKDLM